MLKMVEIPTSSCDKVSAKDVFTGSYSFLERGARVVNLFTRSKDSGEHDATLEENTEPEPVLAPELVSLLARNSLPHLRGTLDLGNPRSSTDFLSSQDGVDREMVLSRHDSESSREFLYKTPAEFASNATLSTTSPVLRLQEFEQEFAKLRAERNRQRTALREEVLSDIDTPAKLDSVSSPSTSVIVPRNFGPLSEHDDRSSLSSRSSEENLTFQDATDDLNDDDESKTESDEKKNTNSSKSVDFSFLHSVYRTKGKHEEAILLSMKYAGNTGLRTDRDDGVGTPDTDSSNSIIPPPRAETKLFKEYANMIRETMIRKCETGATKYRFQERTTAPDVQSVSASGSTTSRQRCDLSSNKSFTPTSNKSSKTSVDMYTESPSRAISLPQSPSTSEQSSPSVSRSETPPARAPKSQPPLGTPSPAFSGHPESSIVVSQQCDSQESFRGQESVRHSPGSPQLSRHEKYSSSATPQRHDAYSPDFHDYDPEPPMTRYPISDAGTEDEWPSTARSDTSGRSSRRKPPLDIPITLDGRIVYPEVIFADTLAGQTRGPLGLLDRVKSFAKCCGPCDEVTQPEQSPIRPTFSEGSFEGEKTSAKLNSALLSRLICVECGSLCTPPIAMCVWGHIVCEECRPVGLWENQGSCWCRKRCPQCAGDMLSRPCELWTNIARSLLYPCRFTSNGCRETQGLTPTEKILHEESCRWRQLRCWCPGCSWRGVWHQMRAHVTKIHLPKATRADWYRFVTVSGATPIGRSSDVIALPANELVLLHSLAVIGEHRYLLQYLTDDGGEAVLFVPRFKLRVVSTDGKSEVEVRGEAVPVQHDVDRALRSGRCFRLSGTPFGRELVDNPTAPENVTVQLCLEKGRLSVL